MDRHQTVCHYVPRNDSFEHMFEDSEVLKKVSEKTGKTVVELLEELKRRKNVLLWMARRGIRSYKEVASYVAYYYARPEEVMRRIGPLVKKAQEAY